MTAEGRMTEDTVGAGGQRLFEVDKRSPVVDMPVPDSFV